MKLKTIGAAARTILSYCLIVFVSIVCFIPLLLLIMLPENYRYTNRLYFAILNFLYKSSLLFLFLPIHLRGKENWPSQPAIIVANHQSSVDVLMIGSLCNGFPHAWLVLEYYAHHFILGPFVRRMNIVVNDTTTVKAARALAHAIHFAKEHCNHMLVFPEGARFADGTIHKFYEGFAVLARKTGRQVIPVFMKNNGKIYPPHSILIHSYPVEAVIGQAFTYNPDSDTDDLFTQKVYNWFVEQNKQNAQE